MTCCAAGLCTIHLRFGILMEVFERNLTSTGFYSAENDCFTVNDLVLTKCSRHMMVKGLIKIYRNRSCVAATVPIRIEVRTCVKGILNSDFGRPHRWVTGGDKFGFEVEDTVTSPGLL